MKQDVFEAKKDDYYALFKAVGEMFEIFKDYTPEMQQELTNLVEKASANAMDLAGGPEIFKIVGSYLKYRYKEMNEYRERRRKLEKELIENLPEIFNKLAVPHDSFCKDFAEIITKNVAKNNYELLTEELIGIIASLE